jgi:cytochrome c oxidase cbb3-type subunit I/II
MANRYRNCIDLGCFFINMIGTIIKRRERHLYVAIWFYLATFVGCSLHIFNSLSLPVSGMKSYSVYAGFKMPWYNGGTVIMRLHFLDYTFLGLMYYFVPKRQTGIFL